MCTSDETDDRWDSSSVEDGEGGVHYLPQPCTWYWILYNITSTELLLINYYKHTHTCTTIISIYPRV